MDAKERETYERAEMEVVNIDPEETILTSSGSGAYTNVYACSNYTI